MSYLHRSRPHFESLDAFFARRQEVFERKLDLRVHRVLKALSVVDKEGEPEHGAGAQPLELVRYRK